MCDDVSHVLYKLYLQHNYNDELVTITAIPNLLRDLVIEAFQGL